MYIKIKVKAYPVVTFICTLCSYAEQRFQWGTIADHVNKPAPLDSDTCYPVSIVLNVCDYFARWTAV